MADCTYPKCQQTAIPGCQGLCRDLSVNRRATDGQRAGVLEGWKLVPEKPTIAMCIRGAAGADNDINGHAAAQVYVAMLAAAPTPPAGDAGQQSPEDRIEALFRNRMTPYGMLVRALRIVAGSTLMDMAERLDKTPAELSAVEMGRKPATPELASATAKFFADKGIHGTQAALMVAVEASKGEKG